MPSFAQLPDTDRWALAFTVGQFAYPQAEAGEALWKDDAALHSVLPDMDALTTLTPAALAGKVGSVNAAALTAFLRRSEGGRCGDEVGNSCRTWWSAYY